MSFIHVYEGDPKVGTVLVISDKTQKPSGASNIKLGKHRGYVNKANSGLIEGKLGDLIVEDVEEGAPVSATLANKLRAMVSKLEQE